MISTWYFLLSKKSNVFDESINPSFWLSCVVNVKHRWFAAKPSVALLITDIQYTIRIDFFALNFSTAFCCESLRSMSWPIWTLNSWPMTLMKTEKNCILFWEIDYEILTPNKNTTNCKTISSFYLPLCQWHYIPLI